MVPKAKDGKTAFTFDPMGTAKVRSQIQPLQRRRRFNESQRPQ